MWEKVTMGMMGRALETGWDPETLDAGVRIEEAAELLRPFRKGERE